MLPCYSKKSLYTYIGNLAGMHVAFHKLITFCNPFEADRFYRWMKVWLCFSDVILVNEFAPCKQYFHMYGSCVFLLLCTLYSKQTPG